jgi:hypothetical protein
VVELLLRVAARPAQVAAAVAVAARADLAVGRVLALLLRAAEITSLRLRQR